MRVWLGYQVARFGVWLGERIAGPAGRDGYRTMLVRAPELENATG